jgi:trehalose 6-phosphate phosphatase
VLYLGDDTTDEDAFRALAGRGGAGEGILVAGSPPAGTAARAYARTPEEVGALFEALAG